MSGDDMSPRSLETGLDDLAELIRRREWEAAHRLGQDMVTVHPTSPQAHAALGDVASARQQYAEAAQWYELSLRLRQSADVQQRLEHAQRSLRAEQELEGEAPIIRRRRPSPVPLWLVLGVAALAVIVLIALVAVSVRHRGRQPQVGRQQAGRPATRAGVRTGATPASPETQPFMAPRPSVQSGDARREAARSGASPSTTRPQGTTVFQQNVTQSIRGPMSDSDRLLTRALSSVTWPSGAAVGADVQAATDPFTGYGMVTLQVPRTVSASEVQPLVLTMAWRLAVAALRNDRSIESMTLRVLVTQSDGSGHESTVVAFRGNTNRQAIDYYSRQGTQPDTQTLWRNVFATTWWNPSVAASGGVQ